jgi:hypothetical protein
MGGRTELNVTELRAVADRVFAAAQQVAEIRWPTLDPDELAGSAVCRIAAPDLIGAKLTDVVANMRGWAVAASTSADAFERAEHGNAGRFHR